MRKPRGVQWTTRSARLLTTVIALSLPACSNSGSPASPQVSSTNARPPGVPTTGSPATGSSTAPSESTSTSTESDSTSTSPDLAKPDPVDDVEYNDIIAQVLTDISTADGDACTLATISASFDSQPDPSTPAQTKQAVHASRALYIAMANDIPLTSDSSLAAGMRKWLSDRDVAMAAALNDPTAYLDFAITPAAQAALAAFQDETTNC